MAQNKIFQTPMDSQNFNAYILQKLGCSPSECERRIKGKNVPIMVIHALVQLRETFNSVSRSIFINVGDG